MSKVLKNIINSSGKKTVVSYTNKEKRTSFDQSFGKDKIDMIDTIISNSKDSKALADKLRA